MTLDKKTSKENILLLLQWLEESLRQDIFPLNFMTTFNKTDMKGKGKKRKISEIRMGTSEKQKFYHHWGYDWTSEGLPLRIMQLNLNLIWWY